MSHFPNSFSIVADIDHQPEILQLIIDSAAYLPEGWRLSGNIIHNVGDKDAMIAAGWDKFPNSCPRFISFNFKQQTIGWAYTRRHGDEIPAYTIEKISKVLDYVYLRAKSGKDPKGTSGLI